MFDGNLKAPLQAGFAASSKVFRKAVQRNRIKRITKEYYRLEKEALKPALAGTGKRLAIFFVYQGKELPDPKDVSKKMKMIIQRLISLTNEIPSAPH